MNLPVTCTCGKMIEVNTALEGVPIACPKCGLLNTLRIPVARRAASLDRDVSLPQWIVAPILTNLAAVSIVIVLVGWWFARPVPRVAPMPEPVAEMDGPLVEIKREVAQHLAVHNPPAEDQAVNLDSLWRKLPRLAPEAAVAERLKPAMDGVPLDQSAIAQALEMPLAAASKAPTELHYSVRRLRLDGGPTKALRLGVTTAGHDDVGTILSKMGEGYRYIKLQNQDLLSYSKLCNFDVLFLNCIDLYAHDFQATLPLRKFVEQGGTIYASDLRGDQVLAAFPEFRARQPLFPGVPQVVEATVVDAGLQAYLGKKKIPLNFDAPSWRPAAFDPNKVTVCLTGEYRNQLGQSQTAPLLVKFRVHQGTVIFTSYHHSQKDSDAVKNVLDYLVFASVNARSEARLRSLLKNHDFTATQMRPAALTMNQPMSLAYQHTGGGLHVALGFESTGARLKLTLRSPSGQTIEHEDDGIFLIDVPNAVEGDWQYTVTPLDLPYANFPVVVAVGTRK